LQADATAMLALVFKMSADLKTGNFVTLLGDTMQAQAIANKAVIDASPFR
jgi:hypothetical protein